LARRGFPTEFTEKKKSTEITENYFKKLCVLCGFFLLCALCGKENQRILSTEIRYKSNDPEMSL
jgi:hypothetical protein